MRTHLLVSSALVTGSLLAPSKGAPPPEPFGDARLKIEYNATDGDAGLQVFLDAPAWREVTITGPGGREVLDVDAGSVIRNFGLTELFSESNEPPFPEFPFEEFKRLFPEGAYTFTGRTVDGGRLQSVFVFNHRVPDAPRITSPSDGANVAADGLTVQWQPVTGPAGVDVAAYQVLVVAEAPGRGNPKRVLDVQLPAAARELKVPPAFLQPGSYKTEVVAVDAGGNQTLSEIAVTVG